MYMDAANGIKREFWEDFNQVTRALKCQHAIKVTILAS